MKFRPCQSYNDCPTMVTIPSRNKYITPYECRCNPRWYRKLYWAVIYPLGHSLLDWYDQEAVMREIEKGRSDHKKV